MKTCRGWLVGAAAVVVLWGLPPARVHAQGTSGWVRPQPDVRDAKYGPHERNVLDLWKAKGPGPTPLVIFIHGGGFRSGDKVNLPAPLLRECLGAGISVASISYRLSQQAPFPALMLDGARAVQFLRSKAKEWNLDPARIAASGGSAGAGISLWVGFHDDLADPKSDDSVARESTRLTCMGVTAAQSSYDPRWIRQVVGGRAGEHPALLPFFGLKPDETDTPRAHKLYEEASPITYVSADDPPVFMYYTESKKPLAADAAPGVGIHHPKFGDALKEKLGPLGVECILRHREDYAADPANASTREMVQFFLRGFKAVKTAPAQ